MSADILDRLRAYDPAADVQVLSVHDEVERIVSAPAPSRARPRLRPRLAVAGLAVAAVAAALVAVNVGSGGSPDLAAKAYAQTTSGDDVLYVRTRLHVEGLPNAQVTTTEQWLRGGQMRAASRTVAGDQTLTAEQVIGPDGVLHVRTSTGEDLTVRPTDGADAAEIIAGVRRGLVGGGIVAQYRAAYENGRLADAGTAEFAGHAAHKYAVDLSAVARAEYYLDAQTGAPLGAVVESHDDRGTYRWVEVVESMERLPPTPENLAKLGG